MDAAMSLAQKALAVSEILRQTYGAPFPFFSTKDALSEMVSALLSHRTKNAVSGQAYRALVQRFPSWDQVRVAQPEEVEAVIRMVTFPEVKAPRIIAALQWVFDHHEGRLNLDFLKDWPVAEARNYLEQIPGIGAKTSAAILNFSHLRMPALVVDTHHQRVAQRIGLVPAAASLDKAARLLADYLPKDWDGQQVYDDHQAFMRHGQMVCYWQKPACGKCVVREMCHWYREHVLETKKPV
jgi:endonuclease-3